MDAAYCYLLRIIDDIWYDPAVAASPELRHWLVRAMHPLMMDVFPPLADILVTVPWRLESATNKVIYAGAAFNFYPHGGQPMTRAQLQRAGRSGRTFGRGAGVGRRVRWCDDGGVYVRCRGWRCVRVGAVCCLFGSRAEVECRR